MLQQHLPHSVADSNSQEPACRLEEAGCPNSSGPQTTIDHQSYPHIIEQILDHSDAELLLTFRRTSNDYARWCLHLLVHHLVVHGTGSSIILQSARGHMPFWSDLTPAQITGNRWLSHCHILDIGNSHSLTSDLLGPATDNLKALRILSGYRQHSSCSLAYYTTPVMVMFGRLPEYDPSTKIWYLWPGDKLPHTNKVVWTISRVEPGLHLFLGRNVSPYPHQVEDAVIHFGRCRVVSDLGQMFSWLAEVVYDIVAHVVSNTVTIVDLDAVSPDGRFVDEIGDRSLYLVEQLGECADRVKFMTMEEYCGEFGKEQYRIETCERLE